MQRTPHVHTPDWAKTAIWYQVFVERFRNGDSSNDPTVATLEDPRVAGWALTPWTSDWYALSEWERARGDFHASIWHRRYGGDLQGVRDKLDYLERLGVNAVYFNPLFMGRSLHKYDGACLHHIDPNFGPDPDGDRALLAASAESEDPRTWVWTAADRLFLELVRDMHARGMHVILDGVFNHSGQDFFAFRDLMTHGRHSRYADWYRVEQWGVTNPAATRVKGWAGFAQLPEFARADGTLVAPVRDYIFAATRRWMDPRGNGDTSAGIDGWRLDVAHDVPHGFWKEWCAHVRAINPDAYTVGEIVGIAPEYLQGDEFDALMNYPFTYCVAEFFVDQETRVSASEFDRRLRALREAYPPEVSAVMQNLLGSHDANRIASALVNPDRNYRDWGAYHASSKLGHNPTFNVRAPNADERQRRRLIVLFQMTYPGAPMVYYGDEAGMWGANDPCNRKPMVWPDMVYADEACDPFDRPRAPDPVAFDDELFRHYATLAHARRRYPALARGTFETLLADGDRELYVFARRHGDDVAVVALNNGDTPQALEWQATWPRGVFRGLLGGQVVTNGGFMLAPVSGEVFLAQLDRQ
jgi:glycosidase